MKKSFAYPYGVWLAVFILAPILMVVVYAFHNADGGFTLHNFSYLPGYLPIFGRSFWLAFLSTLVCLALGYPMAYLMSRLSASKQSLCMMLIMLPMWINFLLRTYAWMSILENNGFINQFFRSIGLISFLQSHFGYSLDYIPLINTQGAIVLGMVYNFLPFMVLPIYTVLIKLDRKLIEAAQTIGITGYPDTPLKQVCDICLELYSPEQLFVSPRVAQFSLIDSLYVSLAVRRKDSVVQNIQRMNEVLQPLRME